LRLLTRVASISVGLLVAIHTLSGRWGGVLLDLDVVDRENTLLASAQILAQPPVGVHVFEDRDLVTNLECAVLRLGVAVESSCSCDLGLRRRLAGCTVGERRRGGGIVGGRWKVIDSHVVEGVGWHRSGIAARRVVEWGFRGQRSHDSVIDLIADGSVLREALKFLDRC
jgi:hypothetical protein